MMRSMSSAISALRNHQLYLDVVANNIANVNTNAYKSTKVSFQELLSQTMRSASAPQGALAGRNAAQVGLGMSLGAIDTNFTQGSLSSTGKLTDLAIQGEGFFVVEGTQGNSFTRDGTLDIGLDGTVVNTSTGMHVLGWSADANGKIDTTKPLGAITIPFGQNMAKATSAVDFQGNLSASAAATTKVSSQFSIYDSLGTAHVLQLDYTRQATPTTPITWNVSVSELDANGNPIAGRATVPAGARVEFDSSGQISTATSNIAITLTCTNGAATPQTINADLSKLTGLAAASEVNPVSQNGLESGSLVSFSVDSYGKVVGVFSNGLNRDLGQLALAKFVNPGGLTRAGENLYTVSTNSGNAQYSQPGRDGRGLISAGYVEMSNVDLAQQFTNMIVAQRGFQANSRVISTSDEMLNELVNLKR